MRSPKVENDNCVFHAPVTILPSPYPKKMYEKCLEIQPIISELMLKLSNDTKFMDNSLKSVVQVDEFTKNLLNVHHIVEREGLGQPITSCINRSDYMLDKYHNDITNRTEIRIRQVEVNAIASAMSPHSCKVKLMHNFLMSKYDLGHEDHTSFPENESLDFIARELINLYDSYGKNGCYILLVTEERSLNFSEHFSIEFTIHKIRSDVRVIRRRFVDLPEVIRLGPNKELLVDGHYEIALVYFRYGYDPSNYNFPGSWDIRLKLERSRAIKCPSIGYHVSGIKKFQQILNSEDQLQRFLSPDKAKQLNQVSCKFWSIEPGTESGVQGFEMGLKHSKNLVLKPQREGGGHNIYGEDIKPFLEKIENSTDRQQYILMELIDSPLEKNRLLLPNDGVTKDESSLTDCNRLVSELGIYGSIVSEGSNVKSNRFAGYLVRSKRHGVHEGGVVSGYSGISSLMLVDESRVELSKFYHF